MNHNDRVLSLLGLGMRARNIVAGEFSVEKAVKSNKALLVIVATDASGNTKKMFYNMCEFYKVPVIEYGTKQSLAGAIGKEERASIAVLNAGIAEGIQELVTNKENSEVKNGEN